jgi:hypothetical protein
VHSCILMKLSYYLHTKCAPVQQDLRMVLAHALIQGFREGTINDRFIVPYHGTWTPFKELVYMNKFRYVF